MTAAVAAAGRGRGARRAEGEGSGRGECAIRGKVAQAGGKRAAVRDTAEGRSRAARQSGVIRWMKSPGAGARGDGKSGLTRGGHLPERGAAEGTGATATSRRERVGEGADAQTRACPDGRAPHRRLHASGPPTAGGRCAHRPHLPHRRGAPRGALQARACTRRRRKSARQTRPARVCRRLSTRRAATLSVGRRLPARTAAGGARPCARIRAWDRRAAGLGGRSPTCVCVGGGRETRVRHGHPSRGGGVDLSNIWLTRTEL